MGLDCGYNTSTWPGGNSTSSPNYNLGIGSTTPNQTPQVKNSSVMNVNNVNGISFKKNTKSTISNAANFA